MPRQQNIFAENPVLQGVTALKTGFDEFADQVTKTRKEYVSFNLLQNVGRARLTPNFQSIMEKVQYGLGSDEAPAEGTAQRALSEAGKPGEVQDVNSVVLYDRMARDRKRAALADAAIQAETGMQKEAQLATIAANLGAVGQMNPQQQNALMLGLSGSMDGFNLSSLFDKMGLGGGSGGGSGSGGSGGGAAYKSKEWVDNGDGTETLMLVDDQGNVFPATGPDGNPMVKVSKAGKPSYDLEGDTGIITMPPEMYNATPEQKQAWKDNVVNTAKNTGYAFTGWDGHSTLFFRKIGGGGGGGGNLRDKTINDRVGRLKALKNAAYQSMKEGKVDHAQEMVRQYNELSRAMRTKYDPEHAHAYKDLPPAKDLSGKSGRTPDPKDEGKGGGLPGKRG